MKTMTEIVDSIKNEKVRAVALDLKEKLENAKVAIIEKRRAKQQLSKDEERSLKTSAYGYVKKGLSVALVTAMLTTCLASCNENFGQGNEGGANAFEESYEGYVPYINELSKRHNLDGPFKEMDYKNMMLRNEKAEELRSKLDDFHKRAEAGNIGAEGEISKRDGFLAFIDGVLNQEDGKCAVIRLSRPESEQYSDDYQHAIIIENDAFYMLSVHNGVDGYFVTGLVDGEFRNDMGLCSSRLDDTIVYYMTHNYTYEGMLENAKMSFLNILLEECSSDKSPYFSGTMKYDGNLEYNQETKSVNADLTSIDLFDKDGKWLYDASVKTGVDASLMTPYTDWVNNMFDDEEATSASENVTAEESAGEQE